jgi:hypothetical protein
MILILLGVLIIIIIAFVLYSSKKKKIVPKIQEKSLFELDNQMFTQEELKEFKDQSNSLQ